MIAIDDIRTNPWQPRRRFDEAEIQSLANSIESIDLIQPIVVRKSVRISDTSPESTSVRISDTLFELVAGERRLRAHKLLGRSEIKAVISVVADNDMAILALAENVDREDLSDYEIATAIRNAEANFPNKTNMAEALGKRRTEIYAYLAFFKLPDAIIADLEINPILIGRSASEEIGAALKKHGQPAIDTLLKLWPRVKSGDLDQGKIASLIEATVTRGEPIKTDRDIKKLFIGKDQAGSMTRDSSGFTIKIKAAALTPEKEAELRSYVERMFGGTA
jgi:ParB family chromosome partitioning protein